MITKAYPGEVPRFTVRPGNGAGVVHVLRGLLAMAQFGRQQANEFLHNGGSYRSGVVWHTGEQLQMLACRIGLASGLCDLGMVPEYAFAHEADEVELPAWSATNPATWTEANQWVWPVLSGLVRIATDDVAITALAGLSGKERADAVRLLAELFEEGYRSPE